MTTPSSADHPPCRRGHAPWGLLLSIILFSVVVAVQAGSSQAVEVTDTFSRYEEGSDGTPDWVPVSGVWRIKSEQYVQTEFRFRGVLTFLRQPDFGDLDLSVRFLARNIGKGVKAAGLVFRARDTANFYYAHFDSKNSQVVLVRSSNEQPWSVLKRASGTTIETDKWHHARVTCRSDTIKVYLDQKLVAEARDSTYAGGKVGLRCGQGVIAFDDFRVEGTRYSLGKEWKIVKGTEEDTDLGAPRLETGERIIAVKDDGMFPVLIKLDDGNLAAVVRGGAPHVGEGGRVDLIKSKDGGRTWSQPTVVADTPPDSRNPAFGQAKDGALVVGYAITGEYVDGKFVSPTTRRYTCWVLRSGDEGDSWSKPYRLDLSPYDYGSPFGKIVRLADGTLLMAVYCWSEDKKSYGSCLFRSTDNGCTWGDLTVIVEGFNETALLLLPDERLIAMLRKDGIYQSVSSDLGRTWTAPGRITKNSRLPADIIRLKSDHLLFCYGHRVIPYGVQCMLSYDSGETWDYEHRVMLEWNAYSTDCGYPSSAQLDDGTIVTMYYGVGNHAYPELKRQYALCVRYTEDDLKAAAPKQ